MMTDPEVTLPTARPRALERLGTRRLTRAHLALQRRQSLCAALGAALGPVAASLGQALATPMTLHARLLDASFLPQRILSRSGAFILVDVNGLGTTAVLELERPFITFAIECLCASPAAEAPVSELTHLEETALAYLSLVALAAVRGVPEVERSLSPRLQGVTALKHEAVAHLEDGPHVVVELALRLGERVSVANLVVPARELQGFAEAHPLDPPPAPAAEVLRTQAEALCRAEPVSLTSKELDALRPGDVLMLEQLRLQSGQIMGNVRVQLLGSLLQGELSQEYFTGTLVPSPLAPELPMVHTAQDAGQLPVDIQVELARVQIPLSDIGLVQAGMLLPLRMNASDPVLLRIGDRAVARAELVDVEGQIGARILALLP